VEGRPLFAHTCILVARCEPLEKMLDGRMKEGSQPEIVIPEYSVRGWLCLASLQFELLSVTNALCHGCYRDAVRRLRGSYGVSLH